MITSAIEHRSSRASTCDAFYKEMQEIATLDIKILQAMTNNDGPTTRQHLPTSPLQLSPALTKHVSFPSRSGLYSVVEGSEVFVDSHSLEATPACRQSGRPLILLHRPCMAPSPNLFLVVLFKALWSLPTGGISLRVGSLSVVGSFSILHSL
jgi:hypothetical protein